MAVLRAAALTVVLSAAAFDAYGESSYEQLARAYGASYGILRYADNGANRCATVPSGSTVAPNGKIVEWKGAARLREVARDCQRVSDSLNSRIRSAYPSRLPELEREMVRGAAELEADSRKFIEGAFRAKPGDAMMGCWIVEQAVVEAAAKNCR